MTPSIVIQKPGMPAEQLFLLFHGVGASAENLVPLGRTLAAAFPNAHVVSVGGTGESDLGSGRQWFSVRGISETNRPERVAAAMPGFLETIGQWQDAARIGAEATTLIGFSQGAIMALESTRQRKAVATRVVSIAGRFAQSPQGPSSGVTIHLLHGKEDPIIHYSQTIAAAEQLDRLGDEVTSDVIPLVGHEINLEVEGKLISRLKEDVRSRGLTRA